MADQTSLLYIGASLAGSSYVDGWLDDIRISKGIARWTTDFTPPLKTTALINGDTDEEYRLLATFIGGNATATGYLLRANNDSASNYGFQRLYGTGSTIGAPRSTATGFRLTLIGEVALNNISLSESLLYAKSGYTRTLLRSVCDSVSGTTVDILEVSGESWNNSTAPVAALTIAADQTNGIGVGSKIILYRKVT